MPLSRMTSVLRGAMLVGMGLSLLGGRVLEAQGPARAPAVEVAPSVLTDPSSDPTDLERPSDNDASLTCLSEILAGNIVSSRCVLDEKDQEQTRQQGRGLNRWLRGGMLLLSQAMNQVRRIGGTADRALEMRAQLQRMSEGFETTRFGDQAAFRLLDASDGVTNRLNNLVASSNDLTKSVDARYLVVEAAMVRAMAEVRDAQTTASSISEQVLASQIRLGAEREILVIGGGGVDAMAPTRVCPPLPADAPPDAEPCGGPDVGNILDPDAGEEDGVMAAASFAAAPGAEGTTGVAETFDCPPSGDEYPAQGAPVVTLEREQVQSSGASTMGSAVIQGITNAKDRVVALLEAERAAWHERRAMVRLRGYMLW